MVRAGVGEEFLLGVAGITATLMGTFLVGVFFYLDSGLHRVRRDQVAADRYMRSGIRAVFVLYAIPLIVPLVLVSFEAIWAALVFIVFSALLLAVSLDAANRLLRSRGVGMSRALVLNEVIADVASVAVITLPWVLGGWVPPPSAFIPSLLLALGAGFISTTTLVLTLYDEPRREPTKE